MTYAGLRGAISLTLMLLVQSYDSDDKSFN